MATWIPDPRDEISRALLEIVDLIKRAKPSEALDRIDALRRDHLGEVRRPLSSDTTNLFEAATTVSAYVGIAARDLKKGDTARALAVLEPAVNVWTRTHQPRRPIA
jgi:hypothetical protein